MSAAVRPLCRPALMLSLLALLSACGDAPPSPNQAADAAAIAPKQPAVASIPTDETPAALMRRANAAFRDNRIVDPSGDNATELFLAVRERAPDHPGLAEALVEIMPLAQLAFDAAMRRDDLAEAERLHGLIARIDAESAITRGTAARVADLRAQRAAAQTEAERLAAAPAISTAARGRPDPANAATRAPVLPTRAVIAAPAPASPIATAASPEPPPAAAIESPDRSSRVAAAVAALPALTAPQPISKVAPDYPPQARSRKLEGFVELEFRVTANGSTEDIRVVRSEPEGLFDRSAVRALMRWKFKPAERNGVPEAATTRTTMNFRQS